MSAPPELFNVLHWNVRGLLGNHRAIALFLQYHKIDIFSVNGTLLTSTSIHSVALPGYELACFLARNAPKIKILIKRFVNHVLPKSQKLDFECPVRRNEADSKYSHSKNKMKSS